MSPELAADYEVCRRLNARHGRTYYLATGLLPAERRPAVHALYAFARHADDLVDHHSAAAAAAALDRLAVDLRAERPAEAVVRAVLDTADRWRIDPQLFEDFLTSMRLDLTVIEYPTFEDLRGYMWGSAAVIGLQMLPILGTVGPAEDAAPYAVALGEAFQLTNFLRDVGEDLDRGRVYLPLADLAAHGLDRERLARRQADGAFRRLMVEQIARTRELYAWAGSGIDLLAPDSRACVRTAHRLYGGILTEIERADYDVFSGRVRVGRGRRAAVALPGLLRARWVRTRSAGGRTPGGAATGS